MAKPLVRLAAVGAAVLLCGSMAQAAKSVYGDVEIATESDPRGQPTHGYTEYRFQVYNKGKDRARRVTLTFPADTIGRRTGSGGIRGISRTVEVGPDSLAIVSLFQPAAPDVLGVNVEVAIDGRRMEDKLGLNPVSGMGGGGYFVAGRRRYSMGMYGGGRGGSEQLVLYSQRIPEAFFQRAGGAVIGGGAGMGGPGAMAPAPAPLPGGIGVKMAAGAAPVMQALEGQLLKADMPVSLWSSRWLAYSRYDGIVVTREDLEELERGTPDTKAVLQALWQYVETGGTMVVLGPGQPTIPAAWSKATEREEGLNIHRAGFGVCIVAPDRDPTRWTFDRWAKVASAVTGSGMPWRSQRGLLELNQGFAVVDDLGIPVRGLFALMILFGLAIGPANLIILSKKNKRIWLLWTVPALSATFCLAVMGYMIVAEGWTGHVRVAGLTLLDETEKRATTIGKTAFYSPMTPGDGLHFSEDTEVQVQGNEHPAYSSYTSIDWTTDQHLTRGWVTARVPAHFTMRKSELRRERLTVRKDADGGVSMLNALGVDIRKLSVADAQGVVYSTGPIPAGGSAKLEKAGGKAAGSPLETWRRLYTGGSDWALGIEKATGSAVSAGRDLLGPGMYVAVVEESPFLEQGLKGARVRPSPSVVVGLMSEVIK